MNAAEYTGMLNVLSYPYSYSLDNVNSNMLFHAQADKVASPVLSHKSSPSLRSSGTAEFEHIPLPETEGLKVTRAGDDEELVT